MANGGSCRVQLHHDLPGDFEGIPKNIQKRILTAIESRLGSAPDQYGVRLRQSLKGFWKLRVGDYRVVYEITGKDVRIYGVMDRKEVYTEIQKRTSEGWPEPPPERPKRDSSSGGK